MRKVVTLLLLLTTVSTLCLAKSQYDLSNKYNEVKTSNEVLHGTMGGLQNELKDAINTNKTLSSELEKAIRSNNELQNKILELEEKAKDSVYIPKGISSVSRGGISQNLVVVRTLTAKATAYGTHIINGGGGYKVTKMGTTPIEGKTIAVDPKVIPLGTLVYVECDEYPSVNGIKVAEDIGSAIKGQRIDIYFDDLKKNPYTANIIMRGFGVRNVKLYILGK